MADAALAIWSVHDVFVQANVVHGYRYLDLSGVVLNVLSDRYKVVNLITPSGTVLSDPVDTKDPYEMQFGSPRIWLHYVGIDAVQKVEGTAPEMMKSIAEKLEMKEFVYDNLPAKVLSEDALIAFMENPDIDAKTLEYLIKNHPTLMKTRDDHKISFGGLSGGPTVNARGEVVGVNVVELGDEGDYVWDQDGITYRPRVTLAILTSDEIKRALSRLNINDR